MKKHLEIISFVIATVILTLAIAGCSTALKGISLPKEFSMEVGSFATLEVTFNPENATNKEVVFSIDDSDIASVNEKSGRILGLKVGETCVNAVSKDGNFISTCILKITERTTPYEYENIFGQKGGVEYVSQIFIPDKAIIDKWQPVPTALVNEENGNMTYWSDCKIWYPKDIAVSTKTYPVIAYSNGSGCDYDTVDEKVDVIGMLEHFASWGFIVVANDQMNDGQGTAIMGSIDYILSENKREGSIFYNKINENQIGVSGGSQGGAGAINAAYKFELSNKISSLCTLSAVMDDFNTAFGWFDTKFNYSKIEVPYFMVAGTGNSDDGILIPLAEFNKNFDACTNAYTVKARVLGAEHGEMSTTGRGYLTAWFLYTLTGNETAAKIFTGEYPEIVVNHRWVDVGIKGERK